MSNHIIKTLFQNIEEWPIAKASKDRKDFIEHLNQFVFERLRDHHADNIPELISKTVYLEKQRIKLNPWKVDPVDDKAYWNNIGTQLELIQNLEEKGNAEEELLKRIINRYSEEIVGHFNKKTFLFSRWFLTTFFKRLFNRYFGKNQWRWGNKSKLLSKIKVTGEIELVRDLFTKGTVVILPTHHSNLDSIMVGYAIDTKMELPVFSYGAGLNLYNVEIAAYFMNRLGAFRVDRRKKNPVYLECLKGMTSYSLTKGINNIFFPGGTRSRSGATESKVKLGLISSLIEAQRLNIENGDPTKIFVVTMNINYHFVLEGKSLIDQYLRHVGREKHVVSRDSKPGIPGYINLISQLFAKESEVYLSLGRVMDVFGNSVNEDGDSLDKFGNSIDIKDYFLTDGHIKADAQRESIYTRLLGEYVTKEYSKNQVVLTSNVVSFVAFQMLFHEYDSQDYVQFINTKLIKPHLKYDMFLEKCHQVVEILLTWSNDHLIQLSPELKDNNIEEIVKDGLGQLGIYHKNVVLKKVNDTIQTEDLSLLFFYHNRLVNYPFESVLSWVSKIKVE